MDSHGVDTMIDENIIELEANSKTDIGEMDSIGRSRMNLGVEELHSDSSEEEHEFVYGDRGLRVGGNHGPNYSVRQSIDIIDKALGFQSDGAEVRLKMRAREQHKRPNSRLEYNTAKQNEAALLEAATDAVSMQVQTQLRLIDNEINTARPPSIDVNTKLSVNESNGGNSTESTHKVSIFGDGNISSDSDKDDKGKHTEAGKASGTHTTGTTSANMIGNSRRNGVAIPSTFNAHKAVIHIEVSDDSDLDLDIHEGAVDTISPLREKNTSKPTPLMRQTTPAIRTVQRHSVMSNDQQELHPLGEVHQTHPTASAALPRRAITLDLSSDSEDEQDFKKKSQVNSVKDLGIAFDVSDSD